MTRMSVLDSARRIERWKMMEEKKDKIILEWETKIEEVKDESRLTAMYCFKSCSVNLY